MKTKELTDLMSEYDSILHEIDKLKERQQEIIAKLLDAKLPYGDKKIGDIVQNHFGTVNKVIRANYPEDSKFYWKPMEISMSIRDLKNRKDRKVIGEQDCSEFGKYPRFELT